MSPTGDDDWRLRADLTGEGATPHRALARFRGPNVDRDAQRAVGHDVVLTHDGAALFAYAADRGVLDRARAPLEAALREDGLQATITISHWEGDLGQWTQVEPPLDSEAAAAHERAVRDAHAPLTQTFTVQIGKEIRAEVEQTMQRFAGERGLECKIVEHPHLLQTQVAFEVSGQAHEVEEFRNTLHAEELATIRTEREVMISPL